MIEGLRPNPEFLALQAAVAGRYSLERELGRGGMGVVYLARDVALERPVAIKLLLPHLTHDAALRERFLREARTAAQLMHPNIVPIHAVEAHEQVVFFAMALVDGETISQRVARLGPLAPHDAMKVMRDIAWALAYAHSRGVIHRDIKPDNIMLEFATGRAVLTDFGIAHVQSTSTLSEQGSFVGTVQFMSPEQASADPVDGRSDIYSLGATTYFALTGVSPVEGPSVPAMLARLVTEESPSLLLVRPDTPPAFGDLVSRASARRLSDRIASADALAVELQSLERSATLVRPEIRGFIREITSAQPFFFGGLLMSALTATLWSLGLVGRELGLILTTIGGVLALTLPLVATAGLLILRSQFIPFAEVCQGLRDEAREIDELRRRTRNALATPQQARSVGRVYLAFGALIAGFGALVVATPPGGRLAGVVFLALGTVYLAAGGALVRATQPLNRFARLMLGGKDSKGRGNGSLTIQALAWLIGRKSIQRLFPGKPQYAPKPAAYGVPSSTLLLQRVEELAAALPRDLKLRLNDLLPAAAALERSGAALRKKIETLDRAIAELPMGSPAREEFNQARARSASRFTDCVTALEALRTDLLRLSVGLGHTDGLTVALEKAKALGAAVDAELHGHDEVRKLLG